jgi:hypothetical protein
VTLSPIDGIREKFAHDQFELSQHALDQTIVRGILPSEIRQAIATGEVIEDYPLDKYGPSCLILGWTADGRPLHVQCSYPSRDRVKVITTYEPDPIRWIEYRQRRSLS